MPTDNCPFYLYENTGWFSYKETCKMTANTISPATYQNYCNGNYENCPNFKPHNDSGGCYLTSACIEAMGLPDDCFELTTLRRFRDNWLAVQEGGSAEIAEYYQIAPEIVRKIHESGDCLQILTELFNKLVKPCVGYIEEGRNVEAHALYKATTEELKEKYL